MLLALGLTLFGIFVTIVLFSLQPILGIVLACALVSGLVLVKKPFLGTLGYISTVGFVALFNLPITADGLRLSSLILIVTLLTVAAVKLIQRDWSLFKIPLGRPEHLLLLAFYAVCIVSIMNSRDTGEALRGLKQFTYCFIAYFLVILTVRAEKDFDLAILAAVLSGAVVGLFGVLEFLNQNIYVTLNYRSVFGADLTRAIQKVSLGRINGLVADGDLHGAFMAFILLLALYLFFRARTFKQKAGLSFVVLLCFFNIFGSAARGAVLGFAVMAVVWWSVWDGRHKVMKALAVVGAAVLVVAVMASTTYLRVERLYTPPQGVDQDTIELRLNLFRMSMDMFADNPVLGHGPNGFNIEYRPYAYRAPPTTRKYPPSDSLNVYTEVLVNFGLTGALVYALFLFFILKRLVLLSWYLRGPHRFAAFSLLAVFCGYSVFMASSGHLVDQIYWLIVSLSAGFHEAFASELAAARTMGPRKRGIEAGDEGVPAGQPAI